MLLIVECKLEHTQPRTLFTHIASAQESMWQV